MISIKYNNQYFALNPDTSIRFSFKFPFPTTETIPAASTYWFDIPVAGNQQIMRNLNYINNTRKIYRLQVQLSVADMHFTSTLYIKNATKYTYKAFVVLNSLIAYFAKEKLSILDHTQYLGETTEEISISVQNLNSVFSTNYAFPMIRNISFFSSNESYLGYINYWDPVTNKPIPNYKDGSGIHDVNVLVAMPKLHYVLTELFKRIDYNINNLFENKPELSKLYLYSNKAIQNNADFEYLFAKNEGIVTNYIVALSFPIIVSDTDNTLSDNNTTYNGTSSGNYRFILRGLAKSSQSSNIFLVVQINGVSEPHIGDYIDREKEVTLQLDATTALNNFEVKFYIYIETVDYIGPYFSSFENFSIEVITSLDGNYDRFGKQFRLGDILPSKTVSDLFNAISKKFAMCFFFDTEKQTAQIQQFSDILNSTEYIDISEIVISKSEELFFDEQQLQFIQEHSTNSLAENNFKPLAGFERLPDVDYIAELSLPNSLNKLVFVRNMNKFYTSAFEGTAYLWKEYSDNFYDITTNSEEKLDIPINMQAVYMYEEGNIMLPNIEQQGSTNTQGDADNGFVLMNFHNFTTIESMSLPLANNSKYLADSIEENYAIDLSAEGIYNIYQKPLADYFNENKPIEFNLFMTTEYFGQLVNLYKANNKTRKVRIGSRKYLPETLDITVKMNGFGDSKIRVR